MTEFEKLYNKAVLAFELIGSHVLIPEPMVHDSVRSYVPVKKSIIQIVNDYQAGNSVLTEEEHNKMKNQVLNHEF